MNPRIENALRRLKKARKALNELVPASTSSINGRNVDAIRYDEAEFLRLQAALEAAEDERDVAYLEVGWTPPNRGATTA